MVGTMNAAKCEKEGQASVIRRWTTLTKPFYEQEMPKKGGRVWFVFYQVLVSGLSRGSPG
jgi:hypothetical protein